MHIKADDLLMKRKMAAVLLALLLLSGCDKSAGSYDRPDQADQAETTALPTTEETIPETVPADGNPKDVTCKGTYTGSEKQDAVIAVSGDAELTNRQLSVWYWGEVAQYRQENHDIAPDFDRPLDAQTCQIDSSVGSWQQYFLREALASWHNTQALVQHSADVPLTLEEAFQPNLVNTEKYMTGMPATSVLYGYASHYSPNSMHQAYLDAVPQMLTELAQEKGYENTDAMARVAFGSTEDALQSVTYSYNRAYMYFTHLSHYIEPSQEELDAFYTANAEDFSGEGIAVDFRQILLIPEDDPEKELTVTVAENGAVSCPEEAWETCQEKARETLDHWRKKNRGTEATFGETARKMSKDTGMYETGGLYRGIRKGQLLDVLDAWCFDPARQPGDTEILRSDYGIHILYFSGSREVAREEAEEACYRVQQELILEDAQKMYPMEVIYSEIFLPEAEGSVSAGEILYPDIAHERFPEIPLYLQQDYPKTMYGGFKITTNGCGITSFAMLASYLTDDELTPPEMCDLYGRYSHSNGTDGMIFNIESAVLGFYLKEKTYDPRVAKAALDEGHVVISIQHPGYWTRGGHYIVCERVNEEGLVQVRDSNIYNYGKLKAHLTDGHKWGNITANGSGFWIFEYKVTDVDGCSRCGDPDGLSRSILHTDYICQKCDTALLRRNTYLH